MSKSQHKLAEKLKQYIPNGYGYNSEFANDLAEVIEYLSKDEQEPVAWASSNIIPLRGLKDNHPCILTAFKCEANTVPLYTNPLKRKPLSHDEITAIALEAHKTISPYLVFCRAVEKAHGIGIAND